MNRIRPLTQAYKKWLEWLGGKMFEIDLAHGSAEVLGRDGSGRRFLRYRVQGGKWSIDQSGALWNGRRLVFAGYSPGYAIHTRLFGFKKTRLSVSGNLMAPWPQQFFTYGDFVLQMLPEVAGILRFVEATEKTKVLFPHADREFVSGYLRRLGLQKRNLLGTRGALFRLEAGSSVFLKEKDPFDAFCASGDLLAECRKHILPAGCTGHGKKIFVLRNQTHRRAVNFPPSECERLKEAGFTLLDPGTLAIDRQVEVFAGAELVAGIHGAGLANILWCKPGTRVVEIFHPGFQPNCYGILSARLGLDYSAVVPAGKQRGVYDIFYRESDVEVDWASFWEELRTNRGMAEK